MTIKPYLFFDGRAEEAIALLPRGPGCGGPHADAVQGIARAAAARRHGAGLRGQGDARDPARLASAELMLSDGHCGGQPEFRGVSLALSPKDAAEAQRLFTALGEGGQVQMPFGPTFFSPGFGVVADRFGVGWMVITEG